MKLVFPFKVEQLSSHEVGVVEGNQPLAYFEVPDSVRKHLSEADYSRISQMLITEVLKSCIKIEL